MLLVDSKKLSGKSLEHIRKLHKAAIGKKLDPEMVARQVSARKTNKQYGVTNEQSQIIKQDRQRIKGG